MRNSNPKVEIVRAICGVFSTAIATWGVITMLCGNPFRRKAKVVYIDRPVSNDNANKEEDP